MSSELIVTWRKLISTILEEPNALFENCRLTDYQTNSHVYRVSPHLEFKSLII